MLSGHDCDFDTLQWWDKLVRVSSEETALTYYDTDSNANPFDMLLLPTYPLLDTEDRDTKTKQYPSDQNPSPTKCNQPQRVTQPQQVTQHTKCSQKRRKTHKKTGRHTVQTNTQQFSQLVLTPPTPCYSSGIVTHFTCPVCLLYFGSILDQQREHHLCQTCGFRV
jgi:hypothetical protein